MNKVDCIYCVVSTENSVKWKEKELTANLQELK